MDVIEGPLVQEGQMGIVENPEPPVPGSQPAFQPAPQLDEATVRAAVMAAEKSGEDPRGLKISDLAQIQTEQPQKAVQDKTPVEVPEKFKKPNGEVDVEKLNASTKQLDELIQKKKEALQSVIGVQDVNKFVDEQLKAYKEKEREARSIPNATRVAAQIPPPAPLPQSPSEVTNDQLEAMINQDIRTNPARAIADLVKLAIRQELEPVYEDKRDTAIRNNLKDLAEKDPRVIQHVAAIQAKLEENPELRNLKNPHKVAWLEVKEDLRLGELSQAPAQPSKPVAPVLGGGTPPPAPSSSTGIVDVNSVLAASKVIGQDPRNAAKKFDKNQWEKLDAIARQVFNK